MLCVAAQNPTTKTAWLALYMPPSTNAFWEVGRCGRTNLMEVTSEDLNTSFVGLGDRLGSAIFGDDWASTAVRVREREIVFARPVRQVGSVYVIWFTRVSAMKYEIQYAVVQTNKRANFSTGRMAGPVWCWRFGSRRRASHRSPSRWAAVPTRQAVPLRTNHATTSFLNMKSPAPSFIHSLTAPHDPFSQSCQHLGHAGQRSPFIRTKNWRGHGVRNSKTFNDLFRR